MMKGMGVDESLVREIVDRVLTVVQPDRIILFGSAANDRMTPHSDIDVLIVEPSPANTVEQHARLHQSLRGLGFPFDVFLIATERFERTKDVFGGIAYPAHKYGRVIYEAA
jgi:predicted nucleotidyltransferase